MFVTSPFGVVFFSVFSFFLQLPASMMQRVQGSLRKPVLGNENAMHALLTNLA